MDPDAGGLTIHALIEAQAAKTPDRIAVVSAARALTYRRLNEEANRLARAMIRQGGPGDLPIVVGCSQGAAKIVALLAALKAGRVVASLDLSDPPARTRSTLEALEARVIVIDHNDRAAARTLVADDDCLINLDALPEDEAVDDLRLPVRAEALARIALTSGSSGEPKGIMQTHRTTLFGAIERNNAVHLCSEDALLVGTSAYTELWRPLLVGATLYLFDFKGDDMICLRRWIDEARISIFRSTPSIFRQLVATLALHDSAKKNGGRNLFPSLRVIEMMGESLSWECVRLYQKHFGRECILVNFLGSKEVLDYRIYYMDHGTRITNGAVPAGFPLGGASVAVVDEEGKRVEQGTTGEIAVKTPSMCLGYWRRPDLTDERFQRDSADGDRMYLTGDRGFLMPDNCLVYVGRQDSTVKIRGHRVDVNYLERVLRDLESVAEVVVVVKDTEHPDPGLVAFVVARAPEGLTELDVRHYLGRRLPNFMIPSEFVFLEKMPTTAMGKTDRERLRSLAPVSQPQTEPTPLPCAPFEAEIAAIWAQVLNRDHIGIQDNFFELGGDSLMIMQVSARLQERFDIDFPLSILFERPTVKRLAHYVFESVHASPEDRRVKHRRIPRRSVNRTSV
jgi:acyl-coenzyme A synthetase/AMP-(fatty) acid ligase/acyl carrier protein